MGLSCPDCGLVISGAPMVGTHLTSEGGKIIGSGFVKISDVEKRLRLSEKRILNLSGRLGVGLSVESSAVRIFRTLILAGAQTGRSIPLVEAVAVQVAAQRAGVILPMKDVTSAHTWRAGEGYGREPWKPIDVNHAFKVKSRMIREGIIPREAPAARELITNDYEIRGEIGEDAYEKALTYSDLPFHPRPHVQAAAAVRVATKEEGVRITFKRIYETFRVPRSTASKAVEALEIALGRSVNTAEVNPPRDQSGLTGEQVRLLRGIRAQDDGGTV